jgi:hypothetical protein
MLELWGDMMKPRREPAISVAMIIRRGQRERRELPII